jgi:hypothetical protein
MAMCRFLELICCWDDPIDGLLHWDPKTPRAVEVTFMIKWETPSLRTSYLISSCLSPVTKRVSQESEQFREDSRSRLDIGCATTGASETHRA